MCKTLFSNQTPFPAEQNEEKVLSILPLFFSLIGYIEDEGALGIDHKEDGDIK